MATEDRYKKDKQLLTIGYIAAIVLAFVGMITSILYLFYFSYNSPLPDVIQRETMVAFTAERRMVLLSTAIFVAMSFGFLGFALFLIQAKGDVDVNIDVKDYKLKFARLSPGLFVILCSTIIIIYSSTFRINYADVDKPSDYHENQEQNQGQIFNPEDPEFDPQSLYSKDTTNQ